MHARVDIVVLDHAVLVRTAVARLHTLVLNSVILSKIASRLPGDKAYILVLYTLPISTSINLLPTLREVYRFGSPSSLLGMVDTLISLSNPAFLWRPATIMGHSSNIANCADC